MSLVNDSTKLVDDETGQYPFFMRDVRARYPQTIFPNEVNTTLLESLNYYVPLETAKPEGEIVTEETPVKVDGVWRQQWAARDKNEQEKALYLASLKVRLLAEFEDFLESEFYRGFSYEIQGQVQHIQVRDKDRNTLISNRTIAKEFIADNIDQTLVFRTYENQSFLLTPQEAIDIANAAFVEVPKAYVVAWAYKDAVNTATTLEELPEPLETIFIQ